MGFGAAALAAVGIGSAVATAGTAATVGVLSVAATAVAGMALEGLVIGGVIGAATSAVTGGDILKGAVTGAVIGGVTGGLGGYLSAPSTALTTASTSGLEAGAAGAMVDPISGLSGAAAEAGAAITDAQASAAVSAADVIAAEEIAKPGLISSVNTPAGQPAAVGQTAAQVTPGAAQVPGSTVQTVNAAQEGLSKSEMLFANALKENSANMWKSTLLQTGAGFLKGAFEPDQSDLMKEKAGYELANFEAMKNSNQAGAVGASGLRKYRALQSFSDKYKAYLAATLQKPTTSVSGSVAGNRGLLQTA